MSEVAVSREADTVSVASGAANLGGPDDDSPYPAATFDLSSGLIAACNAPLASVLGVAAAELVGGPVRELFHVSCQSVLGDVLRLVRSAGVVTLDGLRLRSRDGEPLAVSVHAALLPDRGHGEHARLVLSETTHRQRLERKLAQAERLEAAGRLASSLVHDFNDLLTVIDMAAHRVAEYVPPGSEADGDLALLHQAVAQAAALTQRLHGATASGPVPATLILLNDVITAAAAAGAREGVLAARLRLALEPGLWRCVLGREVARTVVVALVRLAVGASAAAGASVLIETRNVGPGDGDNGGAWVSLRVQADDHGAAVAASPGGFARVAGGGVSTELATARAAVEAQGGQVLVYEVRGGAPLYEVRLPRARHRWGAAGDAALAPVVMVVEDEPTIRAMTARWLRDRGYAVVEAQDGATALERMSLVGAERVDLLLTDVVMPGMSGPELAHTLRAQRPDLRVLFMSAHAPRDPAWSEPSDGPLLEKPFLATDLMASVERALA